MVVLGGHPDLWVDQALSQTTRRSRLVVLGGLPDLWMDQVLSLTTQKVQAGCPRRASRPLGGPGLVSDNREGPGWLS